VARGGRAALGMASSIGTYFSCYFAVQTRVQIHSRLCADRSGGYVMEKRLNRRFRPLWIIYIRKRGSLDFCLTSWCLENACLRSLCLRSQECSASLAASNIFIVFPSQFLGRSAFHLPPSLCVSSHPPFSSLSFATYPNDVPLCQFK
jgi:hypothetical protein